VFHPLNTACPPLEEFGDDPFVPVTAGHFIPNRKFSLHGDIDLDGLDDARSQLVSPLQFSQFISKNSFDHIDLELSVIKKTMNIREDPLPLDHVNLLESIKWNGKEMLFLDPLFSLQIDAIFLFIRYLMGGSFTDQIFSDLPPRTVLDDSDLIRLIF